MAEKDIYAEVAEHVYKTQGRPTVSQLTKQTDEALRAEEQRARPDQQRWERNACAMNLVLLSMQQAGREWFTDHDARVVENITDMTERHILGIAPRRMVAGAGKTFAPRDKTLDAIDAAINTGGKNE